MDLVRLNQPRGFAKTPDRRHIVACERGARVNHESSILQSQKCNKAAKIDPKGAQRILQERDIRRQIRQRIFIWM